MAKRSPTIRQLARDAAEAGGELHVSFPPKHDRVNHPSHYTRGGIEAITVIEAWDLNFHTGNALKYPCLSG